MVTLGRVLLVPRGHAQGPGKEHLPWGSEEAEHALRASLHALCRSVGHGRALIEPGCPTQTTPTHPASWQAHHTDPHPQGPCTSCPSPSLSPSSRSETVPSQLQHHSVTSSHS